MDDLYLGFAEENLNILDQYSLSSFDERLLSKRKETDFKLDRDSFRRFNVFYKVFWKAHPFSDPTPF